MESEVKKIEWEIENTKNSLVDDFKQIGTVIDEKKKNVSDKLNLKLQTQAHPLEYVGGAVLIGLLAGVSLSRKPGSNTFSRTSQVVRDQIGAAGGIVAASLLGKFGNVLGEAFPQWGAEIRNIFQSASSKLHEKTPA